MSVSIRPVPGVTTKRRRSARSGLLALAITPAGEIAAVEERDEAGFELERVARRQRGAAREGENKAEQKRGEAGVFHRERHLAPASQNAMAKRRGGRPAWWPHANGTSPTGARPRPCGAPARRRGRRRRRPRGCPAPPAAPARGSAPPARRGAGRASAGPRSCRRGRRGGSSWATGYHVIASEATCPPAALAKAEAAEPARALTRRAPAASSPGRACRRGDRSRRSHGTANPCSCRYALR